MLSGDMRIFFCFSMLRERERDRKREKRRDRMQEETGLYSGEERYKFDVNVLFPSGGWIRFLKLMEEARDLLEASLGRKKSRIRQPMLQALLDKFVVEPQNERGREGRSLGFVDWAAVM